MSQENRNPVNRRSFLKTAAGAAAAAAAVPTLAFGQSSSSMGTSPDTVVEIFTAALIAEDLATVLYYNAMIGKVMQDVNLAGPGGTALKVSSTGSASNVGYLRAALSEEFAHALFFRTLLGGARFEKDPYQTFYFPAGTFDTLTAFINVLEALENAFIGAYLAAVQEFALMAAVGKPLTQNGVTYQPSELAYFAKIASSILGVESEHRALGRAINPNIIPANNLNYELTSNVHSVYNGSLSAAVALTPFLTWSNGKEPYQLDTAFYGKNTYVIDTVNIVPAET